MSALDLIPDEELAREPVKEPPKRWRNWYRAGERGITSTTDGKVFGRDELVPGYRLWPCKDTAFSAATSSQIDDVLLHGRPVKTYLGAFPEGERP